MAFKRKTEAVEQLDPDVVDETGGEPDTRITHASSDAGRGRPYQRRRVTLFKDTPGEMQTIRTDVLMHTENGTICIRSVYDATPEEIAAARRKSLGLKPIEAQIVRSRRAKALRSNAQRRKLYGEAGGKNLTSGERVTAALQVAQGDPVLERAILAAHAMAAAPSDPPLILAKQFILAARREREGGTNADEVTSGLIQKLASLQSLDPFDVLAIAAALRAEKALPEKLIVSFEKKHEPK